MLFRQIPGVLEEAEAAELLAYAIAHEGDFIPTGLGVACERDDRVRRSRRLQKFGPVQQAFERRIGDMVPQLVEDLKLVPFVPRELETELVAHEDGAFYLRHIDLSTDSEERQKAPGDRMLSIVAYFHRTPRGFSGGALRLFPELRPGEKAPPVDIDPAHNTAVAFSSWLPHEVMPVWCPSASFADARFAVNCWVLR
jgi:Rps23 Pro-64 3,4-dihydroxylase Tpa1-like proline 4-hydroxylase